jgi:hypothetical protein
MGLSTALCRRSLFSIYNVILPGRQCICFAFRFSCFLLDLVCCARVSLLSICMVVMIKYEDEDDDDDINDNSIQLVFIYVQT